MMYILPQFYRPGVGVGWEYITQGYVYNKVSL